MKKKIFGPFLLLLLVCLQSNGQSRITMRIPGVMDKAEELSSLNMEIEAASSWTKGGGASVGKPNPGHLRVQKAYSKAVADMLKNIGMGRSLNEVVIEYYDQSQKPFYTITLTEVYLTELKWLTPECNNCPKLAIGVSMVYKTIKTVDVATGTTVSWDVPAGRVQ